MNKTANINNKENVITVDCKNEKVYFNGNEVLKISMNYMEGILTQQPYAALRDVCNVNLFLEKLDNGVIDDRSLDSEVTNEEMQQFLYNHFEFYALTYKDNANKEHFVIDDTCDWRECGSGYDSIDGWHDTEFNEYVVAYGRNKGKKADAIVMEKPYLYYNGYCNE